MQKLRVGIIGAGMIAKKGHIPGYRLCKSTDVIAIADVDEKRAARIAKQSGIRTVCNSLEQMLEDVSLDLVSVCTPNFTHAEIVNQCLASGINVLVEKPMAMTMDEAEEMVRIAKTNEVALSVVRNMRFMDAPQKALAEIRRGKLGNLVHARVAIFQECPMQWSGSSWFFEKDKSGGGVLTDIGTHALDLLLAFGGDVCRFEVLGGDFLGTMDFETEVHAIFEFEKGGFGSLDVSWVSGANFRQAEVYGTAGGLRIDFSFDNLFYFRGTPNFLSSLKNEVSKTGRTLSGGISGRIFKTLSISFARQISLLSKAIRLEKPVPASGAEALREMRLREAIVEQLQKNQSTRTSAYS